MRLLVRFLVILIAILAGSLLLLGQYPVRVAAELDITTTPSVTLTLFASDWSFLPHIQGDVAGPTVVPTFEPPTATPSPTTTSLPATATSAPTSTATQEPTASPTVTTVPPTTAPPTKTPQPTNTPKPTKTPKPTATPKPTQEPQPTATSAPGDTGDVRITKIYFDGAVPNVESDEYVEIKNVDNKPIKLKGWKLHDNNDIHKYTFPTYTIQPGETCRVYTNENHLEWCGFNWKNGGAIWNNDGDTATLQDSSGKVISICSYSGSGTTASCP